MKQWYILWVKFTDHVCKIMEDSQGKNNQRVTMVGYRTLSALKWWNLRGLGAHKIQRASQIRLIATESKSTLDIAPFHSWKRGYQQMSSPPSVTVNALARSTKSSLNSSLSFEPWRILICSPGPERHIHRCPWLCEEDGNSHSWVPVQIKMEDLLFKDC